MTRLTKMIDKTQDLTVLILNAVIFLPTLGYSLCLLNSGIIPDLDINWEKDIKKWEFKNLFGIRKQPVYSAVKYPK